MEFSKEQRFNEREIGINWRYCKASSSNNDYHGKHDLSYYQPQPDNYNQRQQYFHHRIIQQSTYRTDYDK